MALAATWKFSTIPDYFALASTLGIGCMTPEIKQPDYLACTSSVWHYTRLESIWYMFRVLYALQTLAYL